MTQADNVLCAWSKSVCVPLCHTCRHIDWHRHAKRRPPFFSQGPTLSTPHFPQKANYLPSPYRHTILWQIFSLQTHSIDSLSFRRSALTRSPSTHSLTVPLRSHSLIHCCITAHKLYLPATHTTPFRNSQDKKSWFSDADTSVQTGTPFLCDLGEILWDFEHYLSLHFV